VIAQGVGDGFIAQGFFQALMSTAPFDPDDFPGYHHTMTHEEESAIDDYEHFASYIFTKTP
jgi:hypothetical protein